MSNQKMIIALLGVVAVLLAVVVGVLVFRSPSGVPSVDTSTLPSGTSPSAPGTGGAGAIPGATDPNAPFDPAKATKAEGEPKAHVEKYFGAIVKGDFETAFKLLPTDKQASYGSSTAFAEQLKSYNAKSFTIGKVNASGDTATIEVTLQTASGSFPYTWTFVKYKGAWVVKSRAIGNMGAQ